MDRRERVGEMVEDEEERRTRKRRKKREDDTEARLESGLETAVGAVQRNDKDAGRALEIIIAKADEAAEVGTEEVADANATTRETEVNSEKPPRKERRIGGGKKKKGKRWKRNARWRRLIEILERVSRII